MDYTFSEWLYIEKKRPDLALKPIPDRDSVIIDFLKSKGISVSTEKVKNQENFTKFASFAFLGVLLSNFFANQSDESNDFSALISENTEDSIKVTGSLGRFAKQPNFTPAAVLLGAQQLNSANQSNQLDNWRRWALDNKDFKKFDYENRGKLVDYNKKIVNKLKKPALQKELNELLFPTEYIQSMKKYEGSPQYQNLLKTYNGNIKNLKGTGIRNSSNPYRLIKTEYWDNKNLIKWMKRLVYFAYGYELLQNLPYLFVSFGNFFSTIFFIILSILAAEVIPYIFANLKNINMKSLASARKEDRKLLNRKFPFYKFTN